MAVQKIMTFDCIADHTFPVLPDDALVLDLGANVGQFARGILEKYPSAFVVSFEPTPGLLMSDNPDRWIVRREAVSTSDQRVAFNINPEQASHSNSLVFDAPGRVLVDQISFRTLVDRFPEPDLVKMDIEGAEWGVLLESRPVDLLHVKAYSIEFHDFKDPDSRYKTEKCVLRLQHLGYKLVFSKGLDYLHGTQYADCLFVK